MKLLLLLIFPFLLFANLNTLSNYNKELTVLKAFDVETSFLYDSILNNMIIDVNSENRRWYYLKAMKDANRFIPVVNSILVKKGIPKEFLYLAMAESNFSNIALSDKSASGFWQFMSDTAKSFDLKIDDYVDERRDVIKSTNAASAYLIKLHKRFGKWYLAAIAYNCGEGKLANAIKEAGTDDLAILLDPEAKYLPKESRFYIRKILSFAIVGHEKSYPLESAGSLPISTISVPSNESLYRISKIIDMDLDELIKLNRHLKYDFVPPYAKKYALYIPNEKLNDYNQKYAAQAIKSSYKIHIVKSGDNFSQIGQTYSIPYRVIMEFNHLTSVNLKLKQRIIIPIVQTTQTAKKSTKGNFYEVKAGDSLGSISIAHEISIKKIKLKNQLSSNLIKIGERLKL